MKYAALAVLAAAFGWLVGVLSGAGVSPIVRRGR